MDYYQSEPKEIRHPPGTTTPTKTTKTTKNKDEREEDQESTTSTASPSHPLNIPNDTYDEDSYSEDDEDSEDEQDSQHGYREGFTASKDTKDIEPTKPKSGSMMKSIQNGFASFMAVPAIPKDASQFERIKIGLKLTFSRMVMLCLLILIGINFRFASNTFGNEAYFPTDTTQPPYYPTPEELKELEPMSVRRISCKDNPNAEYIGKYRRVDNTFPEFLYYDGIELPNKDPCITEGATSDGWYIRLSIQLSRLFKIIGEIMSKIFNTIVNAFSSVFSKAVDGMIQPEIEMAEEAGKVISDVEKQMLDAKAQSDIKEAQAKEALYEKRALKDTAMEIKEETARSKLGNLGKLGKPPSKPSSASSTASPAQPQKGKGRGGRQHTSSTSTQWGGASEPSNPSNPHRYSKFLNPYAYDRERKLTDPTYFYRPIWAKSTQVSAVYTNAIFSVFLSFFKGSVKVEDTHSPLKQFLSILLFILLGVLVILVGSFTIPLGGLYAVLMSGIALLVGGGAVPVVVTGLLAISIIGIPLSIYIGMFLFANYIANYGIIIWRILYFFIHVILGPLLSLKQGKEEIKEFFTLLRKDIAGFFMLLWIVFVLSEYQVLGKSDQSTILVGGILAPVLFGFAMKTPSLLKQVGSTASAPAPESAT